MLARHPWTFHALLVLCLLAPLPLGSNRPLSWSLLSAGAAVLAFAAAYRVLVSPLPRWFAHPLTLLVVMTYTLALLWMLCQAVTAPSSSWGHPMWPEASRILGADLSPRISIDPGQTLDAAMRNASYGVVFLAAALFCPVSERAWTAVAYVAYGAAIYCAYGIVLYVLDLRWILWFEKWAYQTDLTSTFVNRNTMATFAGLGLLCSLALMGPREPELRSRLSAPSRSLKLPVRDFLERDARRLVGPAVAFLLTATALLMTHSRAGMVSTLVAICVLLLLLAAIGASGRLRMSALSATIVAGLVYVFSLSGDIVLDRLGALVSNGDARFTVYEQTLTGIQAAPHGGMGAGTFETAFQQFKTDYLSGSRWDKAHSTPIEMLFELGVYGGTLLLGTFVLLFGGFLRGVLMRRRQRILPALGLAATLLVGLHSLVDFSLQIPGFAVVFAMLAGALWPQTYGRAWR